MNAKKAQQHHRVQQLNWQLRQLRLLAAIRGQVVAPMGQVVEKGNVNHNVQPAIEEVAAESEPEILNSVEAEPEMEDDAEPEIQNQSGPEIENEAEPIEFMEVDECSGSNDPPNLQRSSYTHSSAFSLSAKSPDYTLTAKKLESAPEMRQQRPRYLGYLPDKDIPPPTELSHFIEVRVNGMLKNSDAQHVFVREIHCEPMLFTPSSEIRNFLEPFIPYEVVYMQRSLMCFQKTATGCVMFFYLCVQEYDKSCTPPYQNTAYIAMLDSVRLFEPLCKRTNVYNCILISYLQYLRQVGFKNVFLWACPPTLEEEYVFNQRPRSQQTPTQPMLVEWYTNMMKAAEQIRVLKCYSTLYDWCPKKAKEFLSTFPYFPGDHWLEQINETIKSLDKLRFNENNEVILTVPKKKSSSSKGKTSRIAIDKYEYVCKEILKELKLYKNVFFCMTLNDNLAPKVIPSIVIPNAIAYSRERVLNFQKDYKLTTNDLRQAEYTTKLFLIRLHLSWCNLCSICTGTFTNGVRCKVCDQNFCNKCDVFIRLHKHQSSWMQFLPGNGMKSATSKYDLAKWNDFKGELKDGTEEFKMSFILLYLHVKELCKEENRRECFICWSMMKFLFGFLSLRIPSSPSSDSGVSTSCSTSDTSNDDGEPSSTAARIDEQASGIVTTIKRLYRLALNGYPFWSAPDDDEDLGRLYK